MKKKLRVSVFTVICLLGVLVVGLPAAAQKTGTVEGKVTDFDGVVFAGAGVALVQKDDSSVRYEVTADENGFYRMESVLVGTYAIFVYRGSQQQFEIKGLQVRAGKTLTADVDLAKELKKQTPDSQEKILEYMKTIRETKKKSGSLRKNFDQGRKFLANQQYQQAVEAFETAAQIDNKQSAVYSSLGQAYAGAGQAEKGIEAYQKAIALKPEEAGFYNNLGQLYIKTEQIEKAQESFEKAAELSPENAGMFYFNLGVTFYNSGEMKAAIKPFRKASEIDPKHAEAHYFLSVCLFSNAETKIESGEVTMILLPGTRQGFERYLKLEPKGRFVTDAKNYLVAIDTTISSHVNGKM